MILDGYNKVLVSKPEYFITDCGIVLLRMPYNSISTESLISMLDFIHKNDFNTKYTFNKVLKIKEVIRKRNDNIATLFKLLDNNIGESYDY